MKPLKVKNVIIDDGRFNLVLTLTSKSLLQLEKDLIGARERSFSLIEWRGDYLESEGEEISLALLQGLNLIKKIFPRTPLIFTYRAREEGGQSEISEENLLSLRMAMVRSGLIDLIDVEEFWWEDNKSPAIRLAYKTFLNEAKEKGVLVVMSHHDFSNYPGKEAVIQITKTMEKQGADIVKVSVMITTEEELIELMLVSKVLIVSLNVPHVLIGMGDAGRSTRFDIDNFHSCLTYGAYGIKAAPGQLSIVELEAIRLK